MTPKQLEILQHSLGVDYYGRGEQFRSHFVTSPDCADGQLCQQLVALGFMVDRGPQGELTGGMNLYYVTQAGKVAMLQESPTAPPIPKRTPGQVRYQEYLDADCGMPFGEWLKRRKLAVSR